MSVGAASGAAAGRFRPPVTYLLGAALRQWAARPENLGARNELLRALHTLKGSSRLAGAMRLGELAHRLESAMEQIDAHSAQTAQLEPLLGGFDALQTGIQMQAPAAPAPRKLAQPGQHGRPVTT